MSLRIELSHATAVFTGVAEGDLGRTQGPWDAAVERNRLRLLQSLRLRGVEVPAQVHGAAVIDATGGAGYRAGAQEADAIVCREAGTAAGVHVADCLPIVVAGEHALVVIHAGWRGLAGGVIEAGVARLRELTEPVDAAIGPGAGGCCYEAGPEVHAAFADYEASDGPLLDLPAIAARKLAQSGVHDVTTVGVCTLCAPAGLFFSHRRDGARAGRQAGIGWLR
jgi:YfiH family protein